MTTPQQEPGVVFEEPISGSEASRRSRVPEVVRLVAAFALGAGAAVVGLRTFAPQEPLPARPPVHAPTAAASVIPVAKPVAPGPIPESREWPPVQAGTTAKATLWTKTSDAGLLYRLVISELPEGGLEFDPNTRLVINLLDADGFALAELPVDARASVRQRKPDGRVAGYEWVGSLPIGAERYARVQQWSLSSSGIIEFVAPAMGSVDPLILGDRPSSIAATGTQADAAEKQPALAGKQAPDSAKQPAAKPAAAPATPEPAKSAAAAAPKKPAVPPRWQTRSNWPKVTPGMQPPQVLLTLGVPTRKDVREGMETWYYGDLETGGFVFFLGTGTATKVKSVSVPRFK